MTQSTDTSDLRNGQDPHPSPDAAAISAPGADSTSPDGECQAQAAPRNHRQSSVTAIDRISELSLAIQADPARTAAAVEAGEFSIEGSGHPGSLFRSIHRLRTDSDEHIEAWSVLLEIAETLWSSGHHAASLAFVHSANLSLSTPCIFQDRVNSAIQIAGDTVLAGRIEKRFGEGDLEGAVSLANQLISPGSGSYVEELHLRQRYRRRSRFFAFALAGCAMAGLSAISITGALQLQSFLRNPPSFSLPDYPDTGLIEGLKSARLVEGDPPRPEDILERIERESAARPEAASPEGQDRADLPVQPVESSSQETGAVSPPNTRISVAPPEDAAREPLDTHLRSPEEPPSKPVLDVGKIYNCALGQAVSKRAIQIVVEAGTQENAKPVEDFVKKVNAACAEISAPQADINAVIDRIPHDRIETMAKKIAP